MSSPKPNTFTQRYDAALTKLEKASYALTKPERQRMAKLLAKRRATHPATPEE